MIKFLPPEGRILDLGCGHGLFSIAAAVLRPHCQILGVDHDTNRIQMAKGAESSFKNLSFEMGDLKYPSKNDSYKGIAIIDALHYFSTQEQEKVVLHAHELLQAGGILLIREVDQTRGSRSRLNLLYEKFATKIGFTKTAQADCYFRSPLEWTELLKKSGFSVNSGRYSSALFSDVLFTAVKI